MTFAEEKKKLTRAKTRKQVRFPAENGGLIIRHLKCDEAKPHCKRCLKDSLKCDGYQAVMKRKPVQKKTQELPLQLSRSASGKPQLSIPLPRSLFSPFSQLPIEMNLFHHVRTCTFEDLSMVLTPMDFWYLHALPLAHAVDAVKFALCALGAAHKVFKSQRVRTAATRELEEISIQQYNLAIRHIELFTKSASDNNFEIVLTCCIIFICIENLLGRYSVSIGHIQAGGAMLASLQSSSIHKSQAQVTDYGTVGNTLRLLNTMAKLLSILAQDISIFTGSDLIPELYSYSTTLLEPQAPTIPFSSAAAAAEAIHNLECQYSSTIYLARLQFDDLLTTTEGDRHIYSRLGDYGYPWYERMHVKKLDGQFYNWSSRFDLLKSRVDERGTSKAELRQIRNLSVEQAVWLALVELETFDDDIRLDDAENILEKVECVLDSEGLGSEALFSLGGHVLPTIVLVCTACNDAGVQQRCLDLLRSTRRREGFWDSQELADVLQAMVLAVERKLIRWDDVPWQIPQLVKMVSTLNLPELQAPDATLSLVEMLDRVESLCI